MRAVDACAKVKGGIYCNSMHIMARNDGHH